MNKLAKFLQKHFQIFKKVSLLRAMIYTMKYVWRYFVQIKKCEPNTRNFKENCRKNKNLSQGHSKKQFINNKIENINKKT